jgi:hypothetical protein
MTAKISGPLILQKGKTAKISGPLILQNGETTNFKVNATFLLQNWSLFFLHGAAMLRSSVSVNF